MSEVSVKRAKMWQLALFSLNNSGTNAFHIFMTYIAYFASGFSGVAFITASYVMTYMRVFDGFTDPIIGFLMDKLNFGKLGKFRPWMALGNIIMTISLLTLVFGMGSISESFRLFFFIACYFFYIIGYTCQTACTKSAQSCLTKDPKQRPLISMFDALFSIVVIGGYTVFVTAVLVPKYGDYTEALFQEFILVAVVMAFVFTVLAIIGLWGEDISIEKENKSVEKAKISDYILILKHNDAIRRLMSAAALDKLSALTAANPTMLLILFALIIKNYGLLGMMTFIALIPMVITIGIGTRLSRKYDMRHVVIKFKYLSIILMIMMILITTCTDIAGSNLILMLFILCWAIERGISGFVTTTFVPMVADCIDYEQSITGKENPGMIGTMYSLVEKFVSSLSTTIAGIAVAIVGFGEIAPSVNTDLTSGLFAVAIGLVFGFPILASTFTIIQMKRYPLTKEKMVEIQEIIKKGN